MAGVNPYSADMKDSDEVRSWCQELTSNNLCLDSSPLAMLHMLLWGNMGASLHVRVDVVSLFRRDDAKSVCLLRGAPLGDFDDLNDHFIIETDGLDLAGNDIGMIARGLIGEDSTSSLWIAVRISFSKCHLLAQTTNHSGSEILAKHTKKDVLMYTMLAIWLLSPRSVILNLVLSRFAFGYQKFRIG